MRKGTIITVLMILAVFAAACVNVPPAAPAEQPAPAQSPAGADNLAGTGWMLAALAGQQALKDTTVTLNFEEGRAGGSDGCNSYGTSYTADGTNIQIHQPMISTMMACPELIMNQAAAYTKALGQATTYKVESGQLALFDAGGAALVTFTAQSTDLGGTSWQVLSYNNGKQAVVSVINGTTLTAEFVQDGRLTGNAGCNNYTAGYKIDGKRITIEPAASTRMMCGQPEGVMEQEQQYLAALSTAATYRIDGDTMEMRTADGALAAMFTVQSTDLAGTSWQVLSYNNGKQAVVSVINGTTLTAAFGADGQLSGTAGCNNYTGAYTSDGKGSIEIGTIAVTMMMCVEPQGVMEQEQQYLAALSTAATYRIDGDKLEMRTADDALVAMFTAQSTDLAGTSWQVLSYNNGKQAVVSVINGTTLTAAFGADGQLSGTAGCNNYTGTYTSDGKRSIEIGTIAATLMMCVEPQGVMEQEQQYLAALSTVATYRIDGDKLELRTADGALAAQFIAATAASAAPETPDEAATAEAPLSAETPAATTQTVVTLADQSALGKLNGQPVAAVVVITDSGGSGTFYDLAVAAVLDGRPVYLATKHLGDRVKINSVTIQDNRIAVDMITQGPQDPMCCPTQHVVQYYQLEGDQLVQVQS